MNEQEFTPETQPAEEGYFSFPVDITREEYRRFAMLQAAITGPLRRRKVSMVLSLCLFGLLIAMVVWEWITFQEIDWVTLVATPVMLLPVLYTYIIVPRLLMGQAMKTYDRSQQQNEDHFYGIVTLRPDRLEKQGTVRTVKIPYNAHTLFVESPDMMLFINRFSPTVALPARCMTDEAAAAVRAAADKLPTQNRVFKGRLRPQNQPVEPVPFRETPTLWEQVVNYTPDEYFRVSRPLLLRRFWQAAPMLAIFSLFGGYAFGWDGSGNLIPCVLYFLVCLGALTLLNLVLPMRNMRRAALNTDNRQRAVQFRITEAGLFMLQNEAEIVLLWGEIAHVYDKDDMVEIENLQKASLFIPKRCIENLEEFDEIVKKCRKLEN